MEQTFYLKDEGNLSLFEQAQMPGEERAWWVRRLNQKAKDQKKRSDSMKR